MFVQLRSFGNKLVLTLAVTSGLAVIFVCAAILLNRWLDIQHMAEDNLTTHADVIATHSAAALAFDDKDAGRETLRALRKVEGIVSATLYKEDELFTEYTLDSETDLDEGSLAARDQITTKTITVVRPVQLNEEEIGRIELVYNLSRDYKHLRRDVATAAMVGAIALSVSLLLAFWLRSVLGRPISELVTTAKEVTQHRDYSARATHYGDDELGDLTDAFNNMLEQIQARDIELSQAHDELEQRVVERTAELEHAKLEAEAANRAKSDFLANMSHEIRTPMTAILGYSELMMDTEQTQDDRINCIQTIRRNSKHLLDIINDILDISKIEAGRMTVEKIETQLVPLVMDTVSLMRVRAREKNLYFHVEFPDATPATIQTDPTRLRQILVNLIGNAIKFTEKGGIRLIVRVVDADYPNHSRIRFEVIDTGIGVTREQQEKLFRPFTQADGTMARRFGGTGLGLAISRKLAQLLGGDIDIQSTLNEGSSFLLTIAAGSLEGVELLDNVREAEINSEDDESELDMDYSFSKTPDTEGVRILLAEDGPDNQRLISFILRKAGHEVTIADNGAIALKLAMAALGEGQPFDVIFMDMQMPEMDGYTASSKLRSVSYSGPIIALTAHAMAGDRERCISAGCDDYLTKPIDRKKLLQVVAEYTEKASPQT